jgi:hypothetical protein
MKNLLYNRVKISTHDEITVINYENIKISKWGIFICLFLLGNIKLAKCKPA